MKDRIAEFFIFYVNKFKFSSSMHLVFCSALFMIIKILKKGIIIHNYQDTGKGNSSNINRSMNNQVTKYEWIVNKETEWNCHSFILLHYLLFAGLLGTLQSRCVWRVAVKVVDTFYLPQQAAVESRKQNHYVRAVLKSSKLWLIQCNMVPISLSKHLVCYQYSL